MPKLLRSNESGKVESILSLVTEMHKLSQHSPVTGEHINYDKQYIIHVSSKE